MAGHALDTSIGRAAPAERVRPAIAWTAALALAGILLLAGVLRFWGISRESLWLDEATSLVVAENGPAQIVALTAADIHPPLYYFLLHGWLVFGRSEAALRSLSAVIGILSVAALYLLASELWGRRIGMLAALCLSVSPLHVFYSQEARMYVLVAGWSILSSWLMLRAWASGRRWTWAAYALVVALGMYTHYYMAFVVLAQNVFVAYLLIRSRVSRTAIGYWVLAQLGWIVLFLPWVPTVVSQLRNGGGAWLAQAVGRPGLRVLGDTLIGFSIGPARDAFPLWARRAGYVVFGLAVVTAAWVIWRRPHDQPWPPASRLWSWADRGLFAVIGLVVPIGLIWLASQLKPMYSLRYLLPFLPAYCLLLALAAGALWRRWAPAGMALTALIAAFSLAGVWLTAETAQKPDWRGLGAYLSVHSQAGDVVLPEPFWNAKPLRYYAGALTIDDRAPLPANADDAATAAREAGRDHPRLWLVEDVGHYGDLERLLAGYLNAHYARLGSATFVGIGEVALYEMDDAQR